MAATAYVRARIDEKLKEEATAVLADNGAYHIRRSAYCFDQGCLGKSIAFRDARSQ